MADVHKRLDRIEKELDQMESTSGPRLHFVSDTEFLGMPLFNVDIGGAQGSLKVTRGIFAIGNIAVGAVAVGGISVGLLSIGGLAAGLLAFGGKKLELREALKSRLDIFHEQLKVNEPVWERHSLHYGPSTDDMTPC